MHPVIPGCRPLAGPSGGITPAAASAGFEASRLNRFRSTAFPRPSVNVRLNVTGSPSGVSHGKVTAAGG